MSGGEALDLALGLLRAPARRGLLVARPLPSGMTTLLEVAGGSASAARDASAATGATPAELLEAARFFVQQILFHEDADAYRILGTRPDATQARLLAHHRLLQRWLHPDRDGGMAWDSAFSARVNEAWNRLRTPQARRDYDAELAASRPAAVLHAPAARTPPRNPTGLVPAHHVPPPPSTARSVLGPLAVIAVALACIGLLWLVQRDKAPAQDLLPAMPAAAASDPLPQPPGAQAGRAHAAVSETAPVPDTTNPVAPAASAPAEDEPEAIRGNGAARREAGEPGDALAPLAGVPLAPIAAAPDAAEVQPEEPSEPADFPPAVARQTLVVDNQTEPPAPASPTRAADAPSAVPTSASDPLQLLQQAEQTIAQAALYLGSDGSRVPPIWNDFPTEVSAAESRARLATRLEGHGPRPMELVRPQWRMGSADAGVNAGYRVAGRRGVEEGRLRVEMTRREERWLITHLVLEPGP